MVITSKTDQLDRGANNQTQLDTTTPTRSRPAGQQMIRTPFFAVCGLATLLSVLLAALLSGWETDIRAAESSFGEESGTNDPRETGNQQSPVQEAVAAATEKVKEKERKPNEVFANSIKMQFAKIPGGRFSMGSLPAESVQQDEQPQHEVSLSYSFGMGVYEVRQKDFQTVMGENPSAFSTKGIRKEAVSKVETANLPVENVSWSEAMAFCRKLSRRPEERRRGRIYRLPTEAEWEFCCRAETRGEFSFGDRLRPKDACFQDSSTEKSQRYRHPVRVGSYPPNRFGLYDMHGNVFEWCLDRFQEDFYRHSPATDPQGPESGNRHVIRGGGWNLGASPYCRSAFRDSMLAKSRENYLGFRVVCVSGVFGFNESQLLAESGPLIDGGSIASVVKLIEPSVVRISVVTAKGTASGSGCLIFDNRTVVTNFHVIDEATKATVQFADGETIDVLGSVALQPEKDLAVLRLKRPRPKGRPLELVKVLPNKGERVIAFGAPLGLSFSASDGIVSAIRTPEEIARLGGFPHGYGRTATWIQMTTPISPGNSGGPLVNRKGEVVGLNSLILSFRLNKKGEKVRGQNLNFAVSFKDVREIGEKLSTRPVPLKNRGN